MSPQISIIIPCYNQQEFIDRCLISVTQQIFRSWECLLINDGSTDFTPDLCQKWVEKDSRIKLFHKENGGLSSARNTGMENASGTYIFFLDSDDRFANENALQILADAVQPDIDVVTGNIYNEFADGRLAKSTLNIFSAEITIFEKEEVLRAYLEERISAVAWNKLYRRDFIRQFHLKFQNGLLHEDELWSLQVYLNAEKVVTLPNFTYQYYKSNATSITATTNEKNYNSYLFIMKNIAEYAADNPKLLKSTQKSVVRLFEKQYYFLKNSKVKSNPKLWMKYYKKTQSIYKNSILNQYEKRFVYPAPLAFYALKISNSKGAHPILKKIFQKAITF